MAIDAGTISLAELVPGEYERGPTRIKAVRWGGTNTTAVQEFVGTMDDAGSPGFQANAEAGQVYDYLHSTWVTVKRFDWVLRGVKGEFYPCDRHVFAETYSRAAEAAEFSELDRIPAADLTGLPARLMVAIDDWHDRNQVLRDHEHGMGDLLRVLRDAGLGVFQVADRTG